MTNAGLDPLASSGTFPNHILLLHVPMVLLQAADFESSEVVLVHEAFHGGGEGGNRRGEAYSLTIRGSTGRCFRNGRLSFENL